MPSLVIRTDQEGLTTLTLNRPEKLNALNGVLFLELDAHLATDTNNVGAMVMSCNVK